MELKQFIVDAITQIADAISDGNTAVERKGASINPCHKTPDSHLNEPILVEFDVALTVREDAAVEGGGSLKVMGFGLGAKASKSAAESSVSHVRFLLPVQLPVGKQLGMFEPPSGARTRTRENG